MSFFPRRWYLISDINYIYIYIYIIQAGLGHSVRPLNEKREKVALKISLFNSNFSFNETYIYITDVLSDLQSCICIIYIYIYFTQDWITQYVRYIYKYIYIYTFHLMKDDWLFYSISRNFNFVPSEDIGRITNDVHVVISSWIRSIYGHLRYRQYIKCTKYCAPSDKYYEF